VRPSTAQLRHWNSKLKPTRYPPGAALLICPSQMPFSLAFLDCLFTCLSQLPLSNTFLIAFLSCLSHLPFVQSLMHQEEGFPLWCLLIARTLLCVWQLTCRRKQLFLCTLTETCSHLGITTAQMSRPIGTVGKQTKLALCIKAYVLSSEACL
jgi:hypothetical protein